MKTITCARCKSVLTLLQYTENHRNKYYLDPTNKSDHEVENLFIHSSTEPEVMITECRRVTEA